MKFGNKTNIKWYSYKDMGSWYRLMDGILIFAPMNANGTIDKDEGEINSGEVDWEMLEGDYLDNDNKYLVTDRLKVIVKELSERV